MRWLRYSAIAAIGCGTGHATTAGAPASAPADARAATVNAGPVAEAPAPGGSAPPVVPQAPGDESKGTRATERTPKSFPPPDIAPRYPRSAEAGDGRWKPYPEGSPFAKTLIHPHEASRFITVTLVAVDLGAVTLKYMPGTDDLGGQKVPFTAGLVPADDRERLLAVFNGGFQPRHGHWGMKLGETTLVPPRDEGCTLALYADGRVRLRSWTALAATAGELHAFRQTPPCLVEGGAVHPDLLAGRDKAWAGQAKDLVTRRRSAIGLDESGTLLFYAIGVEATPRLLGEALRAAGARNAAELDINWNWTRFFVYEKGGDGKLRIASALAEGEYSKSGYVERASERDFFYVLRR